MKKALIIIDYNNDFVAEDGKLTCSKPAQDLDENIALLVNEFANNDDYIVNACDNHPKENKYSPEYGMFPPHCHTDYGKSLFGKTKIAVENVNSDNYLYLPKERYSAFIGTNLDLKLKERGIKELHLVGVCTDICVLHTAIDAYNLGYSIFVHVDGVASFNDAGHKAALSHFENVLFAKLV